MANDPAMTLAEVQQILRHADINVRAPLRDGADRGDVRQAAGALPTA
jgi:hypothetical protein